MNATAITPFGLTYNRFVLNGMEAEWIIPERPAPPKVILFARINEVLVNQPKASDTLISFAVINTGIPALRFSYHYKLKECFSGALDNFKVAYKWLLGEGYDPEDIILACDTAGARLTIALVEFLSLNDLPLPMGCIKCYPEKEDSSKKKTTINFLALNYLKHAG